MLLPEDQVKKWFVTSHPIYKAFAFLFQNPLWHNSIPRGFTVCPFFWLAMFSFFVFRPAFYVAKVLVYYPIIKPLVFVFGRYGKPIFAIIVVSVLLWLIGVVIIGGIFPMIKNAYLWYAETIKPDLFLFNWFWLIWGNVAVFLVCLGYSSYNRQCKPAYYSYIGLLTAFVTLTLIQPSFVAYPFAGIGNIAGDVAGWIWSVAVSGVSSIFSWALESARALLLFAICFACVSLFGGLIYFLDAVVLPKKREEARQAMTPTQVRQELVAAVYHVAIKSLFKIKRDDWHKFFRSGEGFAVDIARSDFQGSSNYGKYYYNYGEVISRLIASEQRLFQRDPNRVITSRYLGDIIEHFVAALTHEQVRNAYQLFTAKNDSSRIFDDIHELLHRVCLDAGVYDNDGIRQITQRIVENKSNDATFNWPCDLRCIYRYLDDDERAEVRKIQADDCIPLQIYSYLGGSGYQFLLTAAVLRSGGEKLLKDVNAENAAYKRSQETAAKAVVKPDGSPTKFSKFLTAMSNNCVRVTGAMDRVFRPMAKSTKSNIWTFLCFVFTLIKAKKQKACPYIKFTNE